MAAGSALVPGSVQALGSPAIRRARVGRQAIYDRNAQLVSYQLLFTAGQHAEAQDEGERAASEVIVSTFGTFGLEKISAGKPVFINFTRAFLTGEIAIPVEPENVIVEVVGRLTVDDELITGLSELRARGYRIAVDDYRGDSGRAALIDIADFIKIDVAAEDPRVLEAVVRTISYDSAEGADGSDGGDRAVLFATNVADAETFSRCVDLGFRLFQGTYLQRPSVLEQRVLSPNQLVCARLIKELGDEDLPTSRLEQLVGSDPGLTLRLLRTANSVGSGTTHHVESLRQALILIGPKKLRSWVALTLLEGGATGNASDELWSVLARAHACQRLAGNEADLAFTIGLISGAARLLDADVESVARSSGVSDETLAALVQHRGPAGRALAAVLAHERDDETAVAATGLVPLEVSQAYLGALAESLELVRELTGR